MAYLDKHLDTDEILLHTYSPSRKSFIIHYLSALLILAIAIMIGVYRLDFWIDAQYSLAAIYTLIFMFTIIIIIIFLVRIEYQIWSKRYGLTNKRIIISKGFFKEKFNSIGYDVLTDIDIQQFFLDKLFNTGTLMLKTGDGYDIELTLQQVSKPVFIKTQALDQQSIYKSNPKDIGKKVEHYYRPVVESTN